jgi:hypothetical protein
MNVTEYGENGARITGNQLTLPDYLDWMDIEAKAEYFRIIGFGRPETRYVLLESQGQQILLIHPTLEQTSAKAYKEKTSGIQGKIERFIDQRGYSRTPRNQ